MCQTPGKEFMDQNREKNKNTATKFPKMPCLPEILFVFYTK